MNLSSAKSCHPSALQTVVLTLVLIGGFVQAAHAQTMFRGKVSLDDNTAAAGVLVTVYSRGRFLAVETDKDGDFRVANREALAPLTIRVYADGHEAYVRTFERFHVPVEPIRLRRLPGVGRRTCERGCRLSGRVVDDVGQPVAEAIVLAKERTDQAPTRKAISDGTGTFTFDGVTDQPHALIALKDGLALKSPAVVDTRSLLPVELVMNPVKDREAAAFEALDSVVAIATAPGFEGSNFEGRSVVLLATPSSRQRRWQMRTFETPVFEQSALSASGTKIILQRPRRVVPKDRQPTLRERVNLLAIDLTTPVNRVVFGETPIQQTLGGFAVIAGTTTQVDAKMPACGLAATSLNPHDLREKLPMKVGADMHLVEDSCNGGFVVDHPCVTRLTTMRQVAVSARGTVHCSDNAMTLVVAAEGGQEVTPAYRPDPSSVIVADSGDPRSPSVAEFLEVGVTDSRIIVIKDALSGIVLHTIKYEAAPEEIWRAAILAALALQSHSSPQFLTTGMLRDVDTRLAVDSDVWRVRGWSWSARRIRLDERVYAPVLQFEQNEAVFPGRVEVWDSSLLTPTETLPVGVTQLYPGSEQDARRSFLLRQYDSIRRQATPPLGPLAAPEKTDPLARCAIYYKIVDLGTTWLIQYWFYYPFDVGGYGSHLHDSEHLFVEIDKLGGAVLNVIGAAHGGFTANNVFRTASSQLPVSLPLFAIVELGKHATAPDMNRDGRFTPGLDDNIHHSTPQLWGIRDAMGHTDSRLSQFGAHMAADHTLRVTRRGADKTFPVTALDGVHCACDLLPLPEFVSAAVAENCTEGGKVAAPGSECALQFLLSEPDRTNINRVWKKWNFPAQFVRAGWRTASSTTRGGVGADFVIGLEQLTNDIVHGRLSTGFAARSSVSEFTLQYEHPLTNLLGWFAGAEFTRSPSDTGAFRWMLGPSLEFPLPVIGRPGFVALGVGLQDGSELSLQWRFSIGLWARQRYRFVGADR